MAAPVRTRARAIKALFLFFGALALLAVLMVTDIWWLDAAYVGVAFALLVAFFGTNSLQEMALGRSA